MKNKSILAGVLIALAMLYRFIPNLPNFSPVLAISLFAGATMSKKTWHLFILLGFIYCSDFLLNNTVLRGFYPQVDGLVFFSNYMIFTFLSYAVIFILGRVFLKNAGMSKVLILSIVSSLLFFLLTNIGSWVFDPLQLYANNIGGMFTSIVAGLPFFKFSLLADLVFCVIIFGLYNMVSITAWKSTAQEKI